MMLLFFVMICGAAFTDGREETIAKVFDVLGLAFGVTLIFHLKKAAPKTSEELEHLTLVMCFLIGALMSLVAIATVDLTQRAAVGDGGPNTFVRIVGVTAISCVAIKRIPHALAFVGVAFLLALIVLTQSRGGLLAFLLATSLQFIWVFGWRSKLVYGLVGLTAASMIAIFTTTGRRCVEIVEDRVFSQTILYSYTAGRDRIYSDSWDIWLEEFAFGHGLSDWWRRLETYPHNILLELGCDSGALGVGLFLVLLTLAFVNAWKSKTITAKSIACIALFYFLAAQFSGDIYDSRGLFFFCTFICAAPVMASSKTPNRNQNQNHPNAPSTTERALNLSEPAKKHQLISRERHQSHL